MSGRLAGVLFLVICVVLAALLLLHAVASIVTGAAFAGALVALGLASGGFRRRNPK